jgi:hypothetical protein
MPLTPLHPLHAHARLPPPPFNLNAPRAFGVNAAHYVLQNDAGCAWPPSSLALPTLRSDADAGGAGCVPPSGTHAQGPAVLVCVECPVHPPRPLPRPSRLHA